MKDLLKRMLIPQDKANHFVWTVVILDLVLGSTLAFDHLTGLNLSFIFIMMFSFIVTALIGLLKEMRDYRSKQGTPSLKDVLANLYGLITAFGLIVLVVVAYK